MLLTSRIFPLVAMSLVVLSACNPKDAGKAAKDTVAATVNGTPIYQSRVDMVLKQRTSQGQPDSPEMHKAIIDNLALQSLISEEAIKKGLDKTPEVLSQIEITKQSILANAFVQDYLKTNVATDDMIKAEYEKQKAQKAGNEYKARHILVATEAEAKEIIVKLKKDLSAFAALAKEKSKDPGSKVNGGDLGWFSPQGMVPEFGAAVAKLEKGKFTEEPVKSQFGYHIIVLDDVRPIQAPPLEQVKDQLKQMVQQQNVKKFIDDTKAKAKIEIVAAPTPAPIAAPASVPAPALVPTPAPAATPASASAAVVPPTEATKK